MENVGITGEIERRDDTIVPQKHIQQETVPNPKRGQDVIIVEQRPICLENDHLIRDEQALAAVREEVQHAILEEKRGILLSYAI